MRREFQTLNMLRGVAALAVVGRHVDGPWQQILPGSALAVDLFFALSGFVLAHAYAHRLEHDLGAGAFMRLRLVRLYPLYVLGTGIGIASAILSHLIEGGAGAMVFDWGAAITLALLFLPAPFFNDFHIYPFNFPSWSLAWELLVNLFYALIASRLGRGMLIGLLIAGALLLGYSTIRYGGLASGSNTNNWLGGPQRVVYSFFAGVAVYRLWSGGRMPWLRLPPLVAVAILVAIFALRPRDGAALYDGFMALVAFPVLVLASTVEPAAAWRGACDRLGRASYAVYALHVPLAPFLKAALLVIGALAPWQRFAIDTAFIAAIFCAALIADWFYDDPVRRWLSRRLAPGGKPAAPGKSGYGRTT